MAVLNFGFTKIEVEKKGVMSKQINIQSGMNIIDVIESDMVNASKQKAFSIKFSFDTKYEPKLGHIHLEGDLLYLADEAVSKEIATAWKKNKSLPKDIALVVFNKILHNCNVEALILSKEINLPAPIQLPKVRAEMHGKEQKKEKPADKK